MSLPEKVSSMFTKVQSGLTAAHGDTDVGLGQRWSVVNAPAGNGYDFAAPLAFFHNKDLLIGRSSRANNRPTMTVGIELPREDDVRMREQLVPLLFVHVRQRFPENDGPVLVRRPHLQAHLRVAVLSNVALKGPTFIAMQ